MAVLQTVIPRGLRRIRSKNSGHASGGVRSVWYEILCRGCSKISKVGFKRPTICPSCSVLLPVRGYDA